MANYNFTWLAPQDLDFLLWESPALPMHTSAIQVFSLGDLGNAEGGVDIGRIRRANESILHRIPRYRQKIMWTPSGKNAVWVDDEKFNIDYHLRHVALPRPGTEMQLKQMASRIMEYPLDRARPLWETWIVEGLEGDRFASIAKTHHCMVDGSSGNDLAQIILSTEPWSEVSDAPRYVPRPSPAPSLLAAEERRRLFATPARLIGKLRDFAVESDDPIGDAGDRIRALANMASFKINPASEAPFNGEIGPHRIFDYATTSLDDMKAMRRQLAVSVNDLVLTVVTGGLRRFLHRRGVRTDDFDFRVSTPVNVRTEKDQGKLGNKVSSWIVRLPLDEADPLAQLERINETTSEFKESGQASAVELMNALHEFIPMDVQKQAEGTQNMIVTNVPGPTMPLYMLGAELLGMYPQAPLIRSLGLVIGVVSYNGRMCWGFNADRDRVPDLADFRDHILHAFESLAKHAGVALSKPPVPATGA